MPTREIIRRPAPRTGGSWSGSWNGDSCCGSGIVETGPPGTPGQPGVPGPPGVAGAPAWTTVTAPFVVPNTGDSVVVKVANTGWMAEGGFVFVAGAQRVLQVIQVIDSQTVVLANLTPAQAAAIFYYGIADITSVNSPTGTIYDLDIPSFPYAWTPAGNPSVIPDGTIFFVQWAAANQAVNNTVLNINGGSGGPVIFSQAGGVVAPIGPVLKPAQVSILIFQADSQSLVFLC